MASLLQKKIVTLLTFGTVTLGGCQSALPPIETVPHVDLDRFMGKWYVIANIPTFIEKDAYSPVEIYELNDDGTIATTFKFRKGSFEGEHKVYRPKAYVLDRKSNAVWGMQFLWPFKSDYRIVHLAPDYSIAVIGRDKRDYVWIMARLPRMPEADYTKILARLAQQGYDTTMIKKTPQHWDGRSHVRPK